MKSLLAELNMRYFNSANGFFCFHCPLRPCSAGRVPDPPRPYAFRTPAIRGVAAAFRICRFGDSFEHSWRILPGFYYFCPDFPAYL